jgi:hypothetical protein
LVAPTVDNSIGLGGVIGTNTYGWSNIYARNHYYWNGSAYVAANFGSYVTSAVTSVSAGTGVTVTGTSSAPIVNIGQDVSTTASPSFAKTVLDNATSIIIGNAGTKGLFLTNHLGTSYQSLMVYSDDNLYLDNYRNASPAGNIYLRPVDTGYVQIGLNGASGGSLRPGGNRTMSLGTSSLGWSDLYASTHYYWTGSVWASASFGSYVTNTYASALNQSLTTSASPAFSGLTCNGLLNVSGGNVQVGSANTYAVSGGYFGVDATGGINVALAGGGSKTLYFKSGIVYAIV